MRKPRPALPADADAIRQCARLSYQKYIERIGHPPAPMVADFDAHIRNGEIHVLEGDGGVIAGYVVFSAKADHMFLENVAVAPDQQGNGYGRRLIQLVEDKAGDVELDTVRLYTNVHMRENLGLYEALGYRETGRRREDGFDRVFFEKRLA